MLNDFKYEHDESSEKWDLINLIQDLETIKGKSLSIFEKNCLYCFLCRYNIKYIASKLGWSIKSVRTELSRGIYIYIKILLDRDRINCNDIANCLESKYGKQLLIKSKFFSDEYLLSTCDDYRSKSIIALALEKIENHDFNLYDLEREDEETEILLKYADARAKLNEFDKAIIVYKEALEKYSSNLSVLTQIASCLYSLGFYRDSCDICNFVLCYEKENKIKLAAYNLLGVIYREWALFQNNDLYLCNAVYYFTKARDLSEFDVLPIWQIIEILLRFKRNDLNYLSKVKIAISDLLRIIEHPQSNFYFHQEHIFKETREVLANIEEWSNEKYLATYYFIRDSILNT